jgi:hypothetical protein
LNRFGALSVGGALILAVTTACASANTPSADNKPADVMVLNAAAAKTTAAGNAKVSVSITFDTDQQSIHLIGTGVADLTHDKMDVTVTLPAGSPVTGSAEELQIGPVLYFKVPEATRSKTHGKPWVSIDPRTGPGGGSLGQDPNAYLQALNQSLVNVHYAGKETIRGASTRHYTADFDPGKSASPQFAKMAKGLGLLVFPVDCYIDDQGRMRRMVMNFTPKPGGAAASTLKSEFVSMDYFDFGSADTSAIKPPPEDQTIDINDAPEFEASGILG